MTMNHAEYTANEKLNQRMRMNREIWLMQWSQGLGYCNNCDKEYGDIDAILFQDVTHCPGCKKPENKSYYYCSEHGASGCKECKE